MPTGLASNSQAQYDKEWQRYEEFSLQQLDCVPGKDRPWAPQHLWKYLSFRATSCAPTTVRAVLSKLAHTSVSHNYILPLQKHERPTILYKQVKRMVRQLQLQYATRVVTRLKGSTPLGNDAVSAILDLFAVRGEASFNRLPHACRHHIVASVMQHTAGLRFGHFIFRSYSKADLSWSRLGATLLTNWQRYPGRSPAAISFSFQPKWECFRYSVGASGVRLTAANILKWHVARLRATDLLFEPVPGCQADRGDRQRWLRAVIDRCYVTSPKTARAFANITPHSFRGGMAVDMRVLDASFEQVAARGRWLSRRAVKLYAGKCTLGTLCPRQRQPPLSWQQILQLDAVALSRPST